MNVCTTGGMTVNVAASVVPFTVIEAAVEAATGIVEIANVPDVAPAAIVHDAGFAAVWLLSMISVKPPAGAADARVTLPVAPTPPITDVGLTVTLIATGGLMVSVAPTAVPLAVMFAVVKTATGEVLTENVPVFAPPAMVQDAADADAELLANAIVYPVAGAAEPIVTVPVDLLPPVTDVGFNVIAVIFGGLMLNEAIAFAPGELITAAVKAATGFVAIKNVPLVAPAATVHAAGIAAALLLPI